MFCAATVTQWSDSASPNSLLIKNDFLYPRRCGVGPYPYMAIIGGRAE